MNLVHEVSEYHYLELGSSVVFNAILFSAILLCSILLSCSVLSSILCHLPIECGHADLNFDINIYLHFSVDRHSFAADRDLNVNLHFDIHNDRSCFNCLISLDSDTSTGLININIDTSRGHNHAFATDPNYTSEWDRSRDLSASGVSASGIRAPYLELVIPALTDNAQQITTTIRESYEATTTKTVTLAGELCQSQVHAAYFQPLSYPLFDISSSHGAGLIAD